MCICPKIVKDVKNVEKSRFWSRPQDFCQIFDDFGFGFEKFGIGKKVSVLVSVKISVSSFSGHRPSNQFLQSVKQASWVAAQKVRFPNGSPPHLHQEAPAGSVRGCSGLVATKAPLQLAAGCRDRATKAGGRGPPGMLPSWYGSTLEPWQGAGARHLLLLKACCLRNNRCTQVGKQGQRTRSTLSSTLKVRTRCLPGLSTDIKDGLGRAECQLAHKSCHHSNELDQLLRQWG